MGYELKYMERAIKLAKLGVGRVDPNPLVGAVIVKDGKIIGEGYHTGYGMPHAEREALNNLVESAQGAEMYVTMEPCAHQGMQPPCVPAIIDAGIRTVYIGSSDPNPMVNGKGIWMLRHQGIEVVTGVMKKECDALNPVFFHYITTRQPYIVLKYAMTMDGKIATNKGQSRYISGEFSRGRVRALRNQYPAIMVGIGTVLADDPMLDTRRQKDRVPIRIICDTNLRIPIDAKIIKSAGQIRTIIAVGEKAVAGKEEKIRELEVDGVEILRVPEKNGVIDLCTLIPMIGSMGISAVMVEGGGRLAWSFLKEGLVNEVVTYTSPKIFGGSSAPTPVGGDGINTVDEAIPFHLVDSEILPGGDIYARYIIGPEPEEEEEGVEVLAAEPQKIKRIKTAETKLLEAEKAAQTEEEEEEEEDDGWSTADNIPMHHAEPVPESMEDADDAPPVELETRIVTEVLSADLNPFNIENKENK